MDIYVTHTNPPATANHVPDFPIIRFDTGLLVYQEALIDGRYLAANASAMGRPLPRHWVWRDLQGGLDADKPLRTRQHAFQIEVDGQLLVDRWEWVEAREVEPERSGCRESIVTLRHNQRPVEIEIHTRIDGTPFIARWLVITNRGERHAALSRVFPWSAQVWEPVGRGIDCAGLDAHPHGLFTLGRFVFTEAGTEGSFAWMGLPNGLYGFETLHGYSGWGIPCFYLRNEVTGEMAVIQFAWSGNWRVELFNDYEGLTYRTPVEARLYAGVGLAGPSPLRVLAPGESARTPEVHFGYVYGDLDICAQALHAHERRSVIPSQPEGRRHLVEINHTGFTWNAQITQAQLREEIDLAADIGVELFMLDAGWFGDTMETWLQVVGDWDRESPLLTDGVKGIFDYARSKGLLAGLWVGAEGMGEKSHLLRDHPGWPMYKNGKRILNLDLSRPEVAAYLERTIMGLIERYELDCFRLDHNIVVGEGGETERGGFNENILWRYYDALHGIFDHVRARFPHLLLENCSSGGGRLDLGMMSRFHFTQVTDRWSPGPQLKVMNGVTIALPPEACEPLLGGISLGVADLDFMLRIGLFGHFTVSGIFPNMDERQMEAREHWQHTIKLYKDFVRPLIDNCRLFHHTPDQNLAEPGKWVVMECASEDGAKGYAGIFRLPGAEGSVYHFIPKGLDPSRSYRVTYDNIGRSRVLDGGALLDSGLRIPVAGAFRSELLLFETV